MKLAIITTVTFSLGLALSAAAVGTKGQLEVEKRVEHQESTEKALNKAKERRKEFQEKAQEARDRAREQAERELAESERDYHHKDEEQSYESEKRAIDGERRPLKDKVESKREAVSEPIDKEHDGQNFQSELERDRIQKLREQKDEAQKATKKRRAA